MSLVNAGVVTAPSSIAATGGSALAFAAGQSSATTMHLYVSADTDLRTRRTIDVVIKPPKIQPTAPNGYTQARATATYKKPKLLANGKITVNSVQVSMSYDVETTQAEIQELMDVGAQMIFDADFTALWKNQSLG